MYDTFISQLTLPVLLSNECHFAFRMPTGKKVARKQRRHRGGPQPLPMNPTPLRGRHTSLIAYQAGKNLTEPTVGAAATQTWSLTGCYDPDITGTGVQPIGFDPWTTMYQNFLVLRTTYELTFVNTSSNTVRVGFLMSNLNSLPTSVAAWPSDPCGKFSVLGSVGGNRAVKTFKGTVEPWTKMQIPKESYITTPDFQGSAIQNPLRQLYMMTYVNGLSAVANVDTVLRLCFQVEWRNPILQSVS